MLMSMMQAALNRVAPILIRNLLTNNRNPAAIDAQRDAHDKHARPLYPQTVKPPPLAGTGELKQDYGAMNMPDGGAGGAGGAAGSAPPASGIPSSTPLAQQFSREFSARGMVDRYEMQYDAAGGKWEESKHPRASDGRFGNKAGQHGGKGDESENRQRRSDALALGDVPAGIANDIVNKRSQKRQSQQKPPVAQPESTPEQKIDGSQTDEPTTPPPPGGYNPDPAAVNPKTGYTEASRVGVPGMQSPPPPSKIPRLPNLTPDERKAEDAFAKAFEANPDGVANNYMKMVMSGAATKDGTNVFATDDAKKLSGDWNPQGVPQEESFAAKALYNTAVHQTANAIAKRAFTQYLDQVVSKLPDDRKFVLVTAGGVASGKGYAIGQVGEVNSLSQTAGAVWDSAGEQNSTELPWIEQECRKRGLGMVTAYIHATPDITWPRAVGRANTQGRMVDARVFADSYAIGAKNFEAFRQQHANNPNVKSVVIDNTSGNAQILPQVPNAAQMNPDRDYKFAMDWIQNAKSVPGKPGPDGKPTSVPLHPAILRAATAGQRIWNKQGAAPQAAPAAAAKPSVTGQQQTLPGTSGASGQLFNVARPAAAGRKPAAGPPAQSLLAQATPAQRRVLGNKETLSPADLAVKPQMPSKRGQQALFSRSASGLTRQFAEAFAEVGL